MDIFTTVLTRVVAVPIKPIDLKVKAISKEASTRALEQEIDHLQTPEYLALTIKQKQQKQQQQQREQTQPKQQGQPKQQVISGQKSANENTNQKHDPPSEQDIIAPQQKDQHQGDHPHLDIFV
jgi:hypothetical protein